MMCTPHRIRCLLALTVVAVAFAAAIPAAAQPELTYGEYRTLAWAADRLAHLTKFEPLDGEVGMYVGIAERFGTVQVFKTDGRGVSRVWKSIRLSGVPEELLAVDLTGDGFDDALICRTNAGKIYAWRLEDYALVWESLQSEYQTISCFTTANVDEDAANEIVMLADGFIYYVDGVNFTREFTSIETYAATMIRCGDVDGDGRMEIVLNTGQVLDSVTGEVEWADQVFFSKIELVDIDGDGMPEILTENEFGGPIKVFDGDYRSEVRFQ